MVNSTASTPSAEIIGDFPLSKIQERILTISYVFFLYFCLVGLVPFGPRKAYILEDTGNGDLFQQILFLVLAGVFLSFILIRQNWRVIRIAGLWAIVATGWALLSAIWSDTPDIAFRRVSFTIVVILIIYTSTSLLGPVRIFNLLFYVLFGLIIASLISGPIVPNAVHREGMRGAEDLVGLWRGVFIHKNEAGAASAFLILLSFQQLVYGQIIRNRFHLWVALFSGVLLLSLAFSKTSILLILPVLITSSFFYFFITGRDVLHRTLLVILIFMVITTALWLSIHFNILNILDDPKAVTGRATIWSAVIKMISERPYIGYGYGSVFEVGYFTPFKDYASEWAESASHAHNGYLQVTVELGFIGLILVVVGFILIPFKKLIFSKSIPRDFMASLLAITIFFFFHNFFETTLLDRKSSIWVVFLTAVSIIRYYSLLTPVPKEENIP